MSIATTHRDGSMDRDPPPETLDAPMRELDLESDPEHPDIAISHETGCSLSAFASGLVVWENVEADASLACARAAARTQSASVSPARAAAVQRLLDAAANVTAILHRPQAPGGQGFNNSSGGALVYVRPDHASS